MALAELRRFAWLRPFSGCAPGAILEEFKPPEAAHVVIAVCSGLTLAEINEAVAAAWMVIWMWFMDRAESTFGASWAAYQGLNPEAGQRRSSTDTHFLPRGVNSVRSGARLTDL